ncbi:MAG: phosphotransferase [Sedimentisphaerales bacterium]|nr:phosphotransferase [Sedimentisphaerales bacterium]
MPKGGAHFTPEELVRVLSHYDIGVVHKAEAVSAGNRRVPKMVFLSEKGKFFLKRRSRSRNDLKWVTFAHAVQSYLAKDGYPAVSLVTTRDAGSTVLQINHHVYEMFEFVTGSRYDGSAEQTLDIGRRLAGLHRRLADFKSDARPPQACFHDSATVRRHLKTLGSDRLAGPDRQMQVTAEALMPLYNGSSARVNQCGFDSWQEQIIHGDWHPGNMLFNDGRIAAVLDFDSVRLAPPVIDLANAMLQFSIVGGRPNPAEWPDYFDQNKLLGVLAGYRQVIEPDRNKLNALVDLMIETMIAEAVLPVVATGFFGNLSGLDFLKMILRKAKWLDDNREKLAQCIIASGIS